jgi:hypothetical protein
LRTVKIALRVKKHINENYMYPFIFNYFEKFSMISFRKSELILVAEGEELKNRVLGLGVVPRCNGEISVRNIGMG